MATTTRKQPKQTAEEENRVQSSSTGEAQLGSIQQGTMMRAIVQHGYGAPDDVLALREIDRPVVGDAEVLVRVRAAGVGKGDCLIARGLPYIARLGYGPRTPTHGVAGLEVAGRVEAVGATVTRFRPGDDVFGWCNGAFAEYVAVSEDRLAPKPGNLTPEQAAAMPISGFAALQALRDAGRVSPGQRVLVIGASGGVGTFAVQIAKAFGAEVTAVCGTRGVDLVRSVGADHVIDYTREGIAERGPRYDLILDIAGNRSLAELRRALTAMGTVVFVGGSGGPWLMGMGRTLRALLLSPFSRQHLRPFFSRPNKDDLGALTALAEAGKVTPVVGRTYPLSEVPAAIHQLESGGVRGKVVITV
jgi:NADPH:quinone reductase-like Zn-dependent oxidoreductase